MRSRVIGLGAALTVAVGLAGCAPGPSGYASWARLRDQQANEHSYLSQRNAEAAQWQAQSGDYYGAQQSQAAANEEAAQAQRERAHAARDRWFSGF